MTIATIGFLLSDGCYHHCDYRAFATIRVGLSLSDGCYHYRDYRAFAESRLVVLVVITIATIGPSLLSELGFR